MNRSRLPLLLALCFSCAASGANEIQEIIVTAELRQKPLLETPASVSVITAEQIRERSAQHLEQVLTAAPNVNYAAGASRSRYFQVRGIGERGQFQEPLNPSVGVLLDGVDFSGAGTIGTLFDVEQVEVLRGPQGTLHGANALAGLINIRSAAPTEEFEHRIEATAGDYGSYGVGGSSSGPLTGSLLYRLAAWTYRSDGFIDNDFSGDDDTNDRDELTARARLRWLPSDNASLDFSYNHVDIDNGYDAFSLDNRRHTLSDQPGKDRQESSAYALRWHSALPRFSLEALLSYADTEADYGYDEDWTFEGFHPYGYSSTDRYLRDRDSVSAELRLSSNASSLLFGDSTAWVAGLYYLSNEEDLLRRYTYNASDFTSSYDTDTLALFGQLDSALSERLNLVLGLRVEQRDTDYRDNRGVGFDPDKDLWGGKLGLEYRLDDGSLLYAMASRGYRANGVNPEILASLPLVDDPDLVNAMNQRRDYDEETLLNYELGLKGRWLDQRLQARLALFYMDRDDQQVGGNFLLPQPGGATTFIAFTDNAAEGNNFGAELELAWQATDSALLWASLGYLRTEFDDYVTAGGVDTSGRDQAHAPEYQFSTGVRWQFGSGFYLRLEAEGRDAFYYSDEHDRRSDAYELLHARFGFEADNWSLSLWGRNLTDEDYAVRGFFFGNDPRIDYQPATYVQYGDPRMVGVDASYRF
jgi:outer membrane receptor protein involved in Fe transport